MRQEKQDVRETAECIRKTDEKSKILKLETVII